VSQSCLGAPLIDDRYRGQCVCAVRRDWGRDLRGKTGPRDPILYRELDYFEQLGGLKEYGGCDFELIRSLLGRRLVERWEMWRPSIEERGGVAVYPMFDRLVSKMRAAGAPT
jgi:hypothetical protein